MKQHDLKHWETLARRQLFVQQPWIDLSMEVIRLPDGRLVEDFFQLVIPDFVVVFAETADGDVITTRQYKHGARDICLTLPGGLIEKGEEPMAAARRELLEETGWRADDWRHLGSFVMNGNLGCGQGHYFKARACERITDPNSGDLEEMQVELTPKSDLVRSVIRGEMPLFNHAAGIALAALVDEQSPN